MKKSLLIILLSIPLFASNGFSAVTYFNFSGHQGNSLLPGNGDPGTGISNAGDDPGSSGQEIGSGLSYDSSNNTFSFDFEFSGLSSGLRTAAAFGGIHIHGPTTEANPFSNEGVLYYLNPTGISQPGLNLTTSLLTEGVTTGRVTGTLIIDGADEADLLSGLNYINIHSQDYPAGELRGNLSPIPEYSSSSMVLGLTGLSVVLLNMLFRHKRKNQIKNW